MTRMQTLALNTAYKIDASLNGTQPIVRASSFSMSLSLVSRNDQNTSSLITSMTNSVQTSNNNLRAAKACFPVFVAPEAFETQQQVPLTSALLQTSSAGNSTFNQPYVAYLGSIATLSEAVQRRGRLFHPEMNQPVYLALQSLAKIVHVSLANMMSKLPARNFTR